MLPSIVCLISLRNTALNCSFSASFWRADQDGSYWSLILRWQKNWTSRWPFGFDKRIMFGSDASMWPKTLAIGIEAIASADFLNEAQKRDIQYKNAVRFLRLDEKGQSQNERPVEK